MTTFHVEHALIGNLPPTPAECFESAALALEYATDLVEEVADAHPAEGASALASILAADASQIEAAGWVGYVGRVGYTIEPVDACECDANDPW